jgi:hypothetical protein
LAKRKASGHPECLHCRAFPVLHEKSMARL